MSASVNETELLRSAGHLADDGLMAFAALDSALVARWRYGRLAEWIPLEQPICSATPAFLGLETELLALQDDAKTVFALPKIGLSALKGQADKISMEVFWRADDETYLLVISRLGAPMELEVELAKQIRARRIAEDNYRLAKEQMIEKQQLIDLVIDHAPAAIAMFDRQKRYVFATRRWSEDFGLGLEPLAGRTYRDMPPFASTPQLAFLDECLNGAAAQTGIAPLYIAEGRTEWARFDHQPWRRADGGVGGAITFGEVLTKTVETSRELEARNTDLVRANDELQNFASILAHDLSAPLRAIQYALKDISREAQSASPQHESYVRKAIGHTDRMEIMLADLLEYCRIGSQRAAAGSIDVGDLVNQIAASLPGAGTFDIRTSGSPQVIHTSVAPLDLALRNLIDNAIKHHDKNRGAITIATSESAGFWQIAVSDDGPGIDAAHHEAVFRLFQKTGASHGKPGSGVGLALVKKAIEAQGGSIALISKPTVKRGTTFHISLPKAATG